MQRVRSRPNRRSRLLALSVLTVILPTLAASGLWNTPVQGQVRSETLIIVRNIDDYVTNDPGRQYEYTSQMLDQSSYDTLVTLEATRVEPGRYDKKIYALGIGIVSETAITGPREIARLVRVIG